MSQVDTIVVEATSEKSGVSAKGKPWTNYALKDTNDNWYGTFEKGVVSASMEGQTLEIEWEPDGDFKKLLRASPANGDAPLSSQSPQAELVGLRKTRCALWAAFLPDALSAGFTAWSAAQTNEPGTADIVHFLQRFGKQLVVAAEVDIFHRAPAEADEDVPF